MDVSAVKVRFINFTGAYPTSRLPGQQVTGYGHADTNNHWQVLPTKALPETGSGRVVRHDDVIQLRHVNTNTLLLTHDVASTLMATNQEFTTISRDNVGRHNETLFRLNLLEPKGNAPWKTKSGYFRLVHGITRVSLWTHTKQLPEWAFKQQEVNGNKNPTEKSATWFVDDIIADECEFYNNVSTLVLMMFSQLAMSTLIVLETDP